MSVYRYCLIASQFGNLGLVWSEENDNVRIQRVFLPQKATQTIDHIRIEYPQIQTGKNQTIDDMQGKVRAFLDGEDTNFNLEILSLDRVSGFQKQVLLAEAKIPRTWVSTYGRIAWALGKPKSARSVGNALAQNPFPIIIPCHRAIRSDGSLGGFQGGLSMKRKLLEMEGIQFSDNGKVLLHKTYY